jgi:uncharacterized membrane protein
LGSSLQARYRCPVCHELIETKEHCTSGAILVKGKLWVNNNAVNLAATAIGAIICMAELDFGL